MITLKPSKRCRELFGNKIDFDTLSIVYSMIYDSCHKGKVKRNYTINIVISSGIYSYYKYQTGKHVRINISDLVNTVPYFQQTLLHEFRHFLQDKVLKIPYTRANYDDSTDKSYLESPLEIDACNYEDNAFPKVLRIYDQLVKSKADLASIAKYTGK
jgi:hypothetical protein